MAMLEMKNVTKRFEGFAALNGLTVSVPQGAVYGLLGPNGAGKTTAIRHMSGYLRQDEGEVLFDSAPVYENNAAKARMICIPDEPYFYPTANTADMAALAAAMYPRFDRARYERLREVFSFSDRRPLRRLSRGMRKQAAFHLALSCRPELLLLDEPVDGLDPVMRRQIWSLLLADVAEYGTTVLISSHNLRELEDVCDHVGILNRGRCLQERALSELQDNMAKILVALPEGVSLSAELDILHSSAAGRLQTLIVRGDRREAEIRLAAMPPAFMETLPLSLEEIFIYELGGADYEVRNILL